MSTTDSDNNQVLDFELLDRIANYVMFQGMRVQDNGLYHGKAGIALALLRYAHHRENDMMMRLAEDILTEATKRISVRHTFGLEFGLAGIAYTMTLLHQHGLYDGNLASNLKAIDKAIMEYSPLRIQDTSVRTGTAGLWVYALQRLRAGQDAVFNAAYLAELEQSIPSRHPGITGFCLGKDLKKPSFEAKDFIDQPVTLHGGSAYFLYSACP